MLDPLTIDSDDPEISRCPRWYGISALVYRNLKRLQRSYKVYQQLGIVVGGR
jgi:hypothetical protein